MNQDRDTLQHSIYHQECGFPDIADGVQRSKHPINLLHSKLLNERGALYSLSSITFRHIGTPFVISIRKRERIQETLPTRVLWVTLVGWVPSECITWCNKHRRRHHQVDESRKALTQDPNIQAPWRGFHLTSLICLSIPNLQLLHPGLWHEDRRRMGPVSSNTNKMLFLPFPTYKRKRLTMSG